jgi:hypothetical protein
MTSLNGLLGDSCCHVVDLTCLSGPTAGKCCQSVVMTSLNCLLGDGCCHVVDLMCLSGLSAGDFPDSGHD